MHFFDGPNFLVVAHRGFADGVPENTLPAFAKALDTGADILETDVHASSDGVAMISHDPSLDRVAGRPDFLTHLSAQELSSIDLGGASMPRLADALEQFPDARFSIDIKHPLALAPTLQVIRSMNARDRVMVASFTPRLRAEALRALGPIANCATTDQIVPSYLASRAGLSGLVRRVIGEVTAVFVPPTKWGLDLTHPRYLQDLRAAGVTFGAWTINDPAHMTRLWKRGVRAIVTDRTDLAVATRAALSGN